jgi:putative nucleotidyltransferase with HDIG domain
MMMKNLMSIVSQLESYPDPSKIDEALSSCVSYDVSHAKNVSRLAVTISNTIGLSQTQVEGIRMAALVHDIGKVYVPPQILAKRGRLNDEEMSLIQAHPQTAYDILKDVPYPWPIAEIVYQHHERMDGTGYPRRLAGEEVLLEARILAVANTVDAMSSRRPHRPMLGLYAALFEIQKGRGIGYDATAVDACVHILQENNPVMTT